MVLVGEARTLFEKRREANEKTDEPKTTASFSYIKTEILSPVPGDTAVQKARDNASPLHNSKKGRILQSLAASSENEESQEENHDRVKNRQEIENEMKTLSKDCINKSYAKPVQEELLPSNFTWILLDHNEQKIFESKAKTTIEVS